LFFRQKIAVFLSINLQYVPGDLKEYLGLDLPQSDLTNDEVEDLITSESFEPLLDIYLSHPDWEADIEAAGIYARNTFEVLDKLRKLACGCGGRVT